MDGFEKRKHFINYPLPKEGPQVPYKNERKNNPALRGTVLIVAAFLLEWVGFVRRFIWHNAGFGKLRNIRDQLYDYEPRFDPAVIPILDISSTETKNGSTSHLESDSSLKTPSRRPFYSVADYHNLYKSGEITPTAVIKAILPLIRRDISPPGEYSVGWLDSKVELILAAAEASTIRYKEKRPLSPLDGVPTGVKDEYDMIGYKTTLGSLHTYVEEDALPSSDVSWCVRKIEEAGAIILGKLSMHEYGLDTSGNNPHYGTPLNPFNSNYYPGGSSSGCAYAISSGLIPMALGSDGGGSIRIPASFCSVFGLKPTHNRVSHFPGVNHANTTGVNGPLASDIRSLAAFFQVVAAPDPESEFPTLPPLLSPKSNRSKVLGVPEAWFAESTPAIQRLCQSLIEKLKLNYGYEIVPIEIPFLVEGQTAHSVTILNDGATLLPDTSKISPGNKILLALGNATPATDFLLAQKLRRLLMQHLAHLWKKYPGMVIVTPTSSCAGFPIRNSSELKYGVSDGDQTIKTMQYVWMANFTGLPALTIPAGFVIPEGTKGEGQEANDDTQGKVPVGLMGMGEWASEDHLLQWGLDAEDVAADRRRRPPIWVDVIERAKEEMKRNNV